MKRFWLGLATAIILLVSATALGADRVDQVLGRFAHEPTVTEVQNAAMRYAAVHPERLDAYFRGAQFGKLLPRSRVRLDREFDDDRDVTINVSGERTVGIDTDDDTDWSFQAEWRLDELLMSSEKIRVIRENARLVELRDDLLDEVTKLYFDRRRLQVRLLLNPPKDTARRVEDELRLQELTAQIDALTGGFLTSKSRAKKER